MSDFWFSVFVFFVEIILFYLNFLIVLNCPHLKLHWNQAAMVVCIMGAGLWFSNILKFA